MTARKNVLKEDQNTILSVWRNRVEPENQSPNSIDRILKLFAILVCN